MPRRRNVAIIKSAKRVLYKLGIPEIAQTLSCGECGRRLKSSPTQKPHRVVARVCDKVENHKNGKIYLWTMKGVEMVGVST